MQYLASNLVPGALQSRTFFETPCIAPTFVNVPMNLDLARHVLYVERTLLSIVSRPAKLFRREDLKNSIFYVLYQHTYNEPISFPVRSASSANRTTFLEYKHVVLCMNILTCAQLKLDDSV
jgi:hypothetical protein